MINANELRIGNLVASSITEVVFSIDLEYFHDLLLGGFSLDEIDLIPLNDKWLFRFGFVKEKHGWYCLKRGSKKQII